MWLCGGGSVLISRWGGRRPLLEWFWLLSEALKLIYGGVAAENNNQLFRGY